MFSDSSHIDPAVLVQAELSANETTNGSGTIVGPRLVLTAAHVVFGDDSRSLTGVKVGLPGRLFSGRVVWPASYDPVNGAQTADAALIEVTDQDWTPHPPGIRWGRITGRQPIKDCTAIAFPRAKIEVEQGGSRDSDQLSATINPASNVMSGLLEVDVTSAVPVQLRGFPSPWSGASGAGLFAKDLLVGLLLSDERHTYAGDRLRALPVAELAAGADFLRHLKEGRAALGTPAEFQSVELAQTLTAPVRTTGRRQEQFSPASLLRPDAEVVPFGGREEVLGELLDWCASPAFGDVDLRLLAGPGGQGKTRLVRHVAQTLAARSNGRPGALWLTGFLAADAENKPVDLDQIPQTVHPLLVIVDQAESRSGQIDRLLTALREANSSTRARLLLTARSASDWWTELRAQLDLAEDEQLDFELTGLYGEEDRTASFLLALNAFAARLQHERPDTDWRQASARVQAPSDLRDQRYQSPLTLQLEAFTSLMDAAENEVHHKDEAAEAALLRHERVYWRRCATAWELALSPATLQDLVAVCILAGATTSREALTVLGALPALRDANREVLGIASRWLRDLYPASGKQWWGSLQPDRVAEYHAAVRLLADPELIGDLLAVANTTQQEQVFIVMTRTLVNPAISTEKRQHLVDQLTRTLHGHLDRYGPSALLAATQASDPDLLVKAIVLAAADASTEVLEGLVDVLPLTSVTLAPLAEHLTTQLAQRLRTRSDGDVHAQHRLAAALLSLGLRLRALGHHGRALTACKEAVGLYRQLAAFAPATYSAGLGMALSNLSTDYTELGQLEAALASSTEAVGIYQQVRATGDDSCLPGMALALNNQSNHFAAIGHHESALQTSIGVVALYRQLLADEVGGYSAELAVALDNLAQRLATLGYRQRALEAVNESVDLRRVLAANRPDAFTSALADSLNQQSLQYADLGRYEKALEAIIEAVDLHRGLAVIRPNTFTSDVAMSVGNLALRLREAGRHREALEAASESVDLYRQLAEDRPDTFTARLASALSNLSTVLAEVGEHARSLQTITESVALHREVGAFRPDVPKPELAKALSNQSVRLMNLNHHQHALAAVTEAVEIYRPLAADRPHAYNADLAAALNNQSNLLSDFNQSEAGLAAILEARGIYQQLATTYPSAYLSYYASAEGNLADRYAELGRYSESLEAEAKAIGIYRRLSTERPDAMLPLALRLNNQSVTFAELGEYERAVEASRESVDIYRQLDPDRARAQAEPFARALENLRSQLNRLEAQKAAIEEASEDFEELDASRSGPDELTDPWSALGPSLQVVNQYRRLMSTHPEVLSELGHALMNHGVRLTNAEFFHEAVAVDLEAVSIFAFLARRRPDIFTQDCETAVEYTRIDCDNLGYDDARAEVEIRAALDRHP